MTHGEAQRLLKKLDQLIYVPSVAQGVEDIVPEAYCKPEDKDDDEESDNQDYREKPARASPLPPAHGRPPP